MMWLVCCEPYPSEKGAKRALCVCSGAWGAEGTMCQPCQGNLKGKKVADVAGTEQRTVDGKDLLSTDSGPEMFCEVVSDHLEGGRACQGWAQGPT